VVAVRCGVVEVQDVAPLYHNADIVNDPELTRLLKEADAAGAISTELDAKLDARLEELFDTLPEALGAALLERLKANTADMLADRYSARSGFVKRQREKWGTAFDKLKALVEAASESGSEFVQQFAAEAADKHDFLFDALARLHARACLIANEVLWLMEGGFASGAMARWRTLHEVAVIAYFLREHGQDAAERNLHHEAIEAYHAADQYQKHCGTLGKEALPATTIERLEIAQSDLCTRFGQPYGRSEWGWAAAALKSASVSFTQNEKSVNMDHMRPYFKLACYSNHAGSRGLRYDLGKARH
jgi:hypothetical protein